LFGGDLLGPALALNTVISSLYGSFSLMVFALLIIHSSITVVYAAYLAQEVVRIRNLGRWHCCVASPV